TLTADDPSPTAAPPLVCPPAAGCLPQPAPTPPQPPSPLFHHPPPYLPLSSFPHAHLSASCHPLTAFPPLVPIHLPPTLTHRQTIDKIRVNCGKGHPYHTANVSHLLTQPQRLSLSLEQSRHPATLRRQPLVNPPTQWTRTVGWADALLMSICQHGFKENIQLAVVMSNIEFNSLQSMQAMAQKA
ncbi:uncharacterized protein VP01_11138g1, partial [Puccinia sorghi]